MNNLPEKLTSKQKKFIADLSLLGLTETSDKFWILWNEEYPEDGVDTARRIAADKRETTHREAEAVLLSLYSGRTLEEHTCKSCGRKFLTNYVYNRHCTEECLRDSLGRRGLRWDPSRQAADRWCGEPPASITPDTLEFLKKWARNLLAISPMAEEIFSDDEEIQNILDSI